MERQFSPVTGPAGRAETTKPLGTFSPLSSFSSLIDECCELAAEFCKQLRKLGSDDELN